MPDLFRLHLLAVASGDKSSRLFSDIAPWLVVLIALVLVGGVVIFLIRRWLRSDAASSSGGFTLQDLRDLHAAGELSDAEFEIAKSQMIGRLRTPANLPRKPGPDASPGNSGE